MIENYRLANVATYDEEGASVADLNVINFFYGANGSGKTTTSDFLTDPSLPKFDSSSLQWKGDVPLKTLVYNKKFRDENFSKSDEIAGIFTLGEASAEAVKEIKTKKEKITDLKEEKRKRNETLDSKISGAKRAQDEFTEKCWILKKTYQETFSSAFRGYMGSKANFRDKIIGVSFAEEKLEQSLENLIERGNSFTGKKPELLNPIPTLPQVDEISRIEQLDIWKKNIIGKGDVPISDLIIKLKMTDWVNSGKKYMQDEICPFCQNSTIDDEFRKQLELYFDDSFERDKATISDATDSYFMNIGGLIKDIESLLGHLSENELFSSVTKIDLTQLKNLSLSFKNIADTNLASMTHKKEMVSIPMQLHSSGQSLTELVKCLEIANKRIDKHNDIVSDFASKQAQYFNDVWCFIANELEGDTRRFKKEKESLNKAIDGISNQIEKNSELTCQLEQDIAQLGKNLTSVAPSVKEINRLLKAYGFINFKIVESQEKNNYYCIQRQDGSPALHSLSEGEVTFITFLYFVQLIKGGQTTAEVYADRIIVIDDPISSLDSNILYIVSAIVKDLIREVKSSSSIKQLLLLTHNVYFHKEASFEGGRTNGCNKTNFYIIRKSDNVSKIYSHGMTNPINSSYELLWKELREQANSSSITIQNTMRRILENYFKILGKFDDKDIVDRFDTLEEKQTCRALLYWINDGSHCLPDDLFIQEDPESTVKFVKIFRDIFDKSGHLAHYNMMMGEDAPEAEAI